MSLYLSCLNLIERLAGVPDFEQFLSPDLLLRLQAESALDSTPNDPVSQLWILFRLGTPFGCILNGFKPSQPFDIQSAELSLTNVNACKEWVFRFIVACLKEHQFEKENVFTISELYHDNTNGFVKVINTVSMVLDLMERKGLLRARRSSKRNSDPGPPTDNRARVVNEILNTERTYVQDLENLQAYMRALQSDGTVVSPETIHLIFGNLNALVDFQRRFLIAIETNAALTPQEQNFGQIFLQHEEAFTVYEPFCANVGDASALVVQEYEKLVKMNNLIEAQRGINSHLIKPVQRICKYPLLMHELIKLTDSEHPFYRDLMEGEDAIKRVAERINEAKRQQENMATALALQYQVAWKDGELVSDFGALLLHDSLLNPRGTPDKLLEVYLFEKILVCCQSIVSRKKPVKPLARGSKPKPTLHLNGRIYINNIKSILPVSVAGTHVLHVVWNVAAEEFELRCRNEDQLKKWHSVLEKLVSEANAERSEINLSNQLDPLTLSHDNQSSFFRNDDDYLEDDLDGDEEESYDESRGYRGHNLPFGLAQPIMLGSRSRAKTEDGSVPAPGNWNGRTAGYNANATANGRTLAPGMALPPLPRTSSGAGTAMGVVSPGEYTYSPPSSYPASPTVPNPRISGGSSCQRRSNGDGHSPLNDTMSKFEDGVITSGGQPLVRNASAGYSYNTTPPAAPPVPPIPGPLRIRAQSSPNIHSSSSGPSWNNVPEMPTHHRKPSNTSGPSSPTTPHPTSSYGSNGAPAVPSIPSCHTSPRPELRQQSSSGNLSANGVPQLKVKVNYQEDSYLIVVPVQIEYSELIERVERKLRLCGSRRGEQPLRLRYKDEDNDYINMEDDEDISLAMESCLADGIMNLHVI
ncbi:hypothetical protein FBU30_000048 [Linnemannia zychae]|nr:hypothetical protein FBU30_000048 [Linnemannia zychae]